MTNPKIIIFVVTSALIIGGYIYNRFNKPKKKLMY